MPSDLKSGDTEKPEVKRDEILLKNWSCFVADFLCLFRCGKKLRGINDVLGVYEGVDIIECIKMNKCGSLIYEAEENHQRVWECMCQMIDSVLKVGGIRKVSITKEQID